MVTDRFAGVFSKVALAIKVGSVSSAFQADIISLVTLSAVPDHVMIPAFILSNRPALALLTLALNDSDTFEEPPIKSFTFARSII